VKTISAIIIAGVLSTLPAAGRADDVKANGAKHASPAAATTNGAREHAAPCSCGAQKADTSGTDAQQVVRPYDPWSDLSHGYGN
jgi:hypothetical protein